MNKLKEHIIALSHAITEERKDILKSSKEVTDGLFHECIESLSLHYAHEHGMTLSPMPEKERDLLLMAHARHACLKSGNFDSSLTYLSGHMDGQRRLFSLAEKLSLALQGFKAAHVCSVEHAMTCPTNRAAEEALQAFNEWKDSELISTTKKT